MIFLLSFTMIFLFCLALFSLYFLPLFFLFFSRFCLSFFPIFFWQALVPMHLPFYDTSQNSFVVSSRCPRKSDHRITRAPLYPGTAPELDSSTAPGWPDASLGMFRQCSLITRHTLSLVDSRSRPDSNGTPRSADDGPSAMGIAQHTGERFLEKTSRGDGSSDAFRTHCPMASQN